MTARFSSAIALFEEDPDLLGELEPERAAAARTRVRVLVVALRSGPCELRARNGHAHSHIGVLVLDGLLTRNTSLVGRTTMELVGARDIVRPWDEDGDGTSVPEEVTWTVHVPARVALLDQRFVERVAPWPEITRTLISRSVDRQRRLSHHLAILDNPRVDTRLLLLFWHLADMWGRVGSEGVTVPLPLTHKTLGRLVRAHRPSVTASLNDLAARGLVTRKDDGTWLLHGGPEALRDAGSAQLPGRLPLRRTDA
jgi:CRP-like cAMP-binding protein